MMLFIPRNYLSCYHNFMIKQEIVGSYLVGFYLVAQLKFTKSTSSFYTLAFIDRDSIEKARIWADLNNITLDVE